MASFKKEINKFKYTPRYYKGEGNPYKFKGKFDEFRASTGTATPQIGFKAIFSGGIKNKIKLALNEFRNGGYKVNRTILMIACILAFVFLWLIDFDLSIFKTKK